MLEIAPGWQLAVERGPDWLFVRLHAPETTDAEAPPLANRLWNLMQQHCVNRIVLEMDELPSLSRELIDQLAQLQQKVHESGGLVRLSGLSSESRRALAAAHVDDRLPAYANRSMAVMGHLPNKPR